MARGPAYPFINLTDAIGFAQKLYDFAKRSPANVTAVVKEKWGYSPTSSTPGKVIAALRYFGLIDLLGAGEVESVKISERAYRILVDDPNSPERQKAIQEAALSPKAYKMCWDRWGQELPASMRSSLIFEHGFLDSTVDAFLINYRKTLDAAGLLEAEPNESGEDDPPKVEFGAPSGGDIQYAPTRVLPTAAPLPAKGAGMRQEVFSLAEGDVTIQWPEVMSAESLEDFQDWLKILERKVKRSVAPQAPSRRAQLNDDPDEL